MRHTQELEAREREPKYITPTYTSDAINKKEHCDYIPLKGIAGNQVKNKKKKKLQKWI